MFGVAEDFFRSDNGGFLRWLRRSFSGWRRGFSDEAGRKCSAGRRIGSGQPPAQHKSIAGGCLFPCSCCHSVSQEPEPHDAGVSRFVGNGSHLAEMDAAEGHAGWVDGPGSSGNTGIGSHPAEVDAAESYAGQVGSLGSSRSAGTGSHPAEADAAEGKTVHARRFPSASVMTGGPAGPSEQDARDRPALPDPVGHVAHGQNAVWSGCP